MNEQTKRIRERIVHWLSVCNGSMDSKSLEAVLQGEGFDTRNFQRHCRKVGAIARTTGIGHGWLWSLPAHLRINKSAKPS